VDAKSAEVAFLVQEELHGRGIATFMLSCLEKIARQNNYSCFTALVLAENRKMINVFKNTYPHAEFIRGESGEIEVTMPFIIGKHNTPHDQSPE
jgi:GNAT superfamily N-acetyltransferase